MEQMTKTLWENINDFYIPLILTVINKADYDRQMMFDVARMHICEMDGFIKGYLYLMPYGSDKHENFKLASEVSREIYNELWEIYLNRD